MQISSYNRDLTYKHASSPSFRGVEIDRDIFRLGKAAVDAVISAGDELEIIGKDVTLIVTTYENKIMCVVNEKNFFKSLLNAVRQNCGRGYTWRFTHDDVVRAAKTAVDNHNKALEKLKNKTFKK